MSGKSRRRRAEGASSLTPRAQRRRAETAAGPPVHRQSERQRQNERPWWALTVFATAFVVRLAHLLELRSTVWLALPLGDAASYDAWARRIAAGDWLGGPDVFYQAPLYPYVLAIIYGTLGTDPMLVRLCQAVIGSLSCVLLADAGRHLISPRAGFWAGIMLALYAPAIFHDALLQKSVLDIFFLCAALSIFARLMRTPRATLGALLGVALGCLTLTRENAAVVLAPMLLWLILELRSRLRPAGASGAKAPPYVPTKNHHGGASRRALAGLLAGYVIALTPVALRNAWVGGEFHVTTAQFGPNFYIGNNPEADGTYRSLVPRRGKAEYERHDATILAERAMGRTLTPAEVSSFYVERALGYIKSRPREWLKLIAWKFVLAWNSIEIADTEDQYTFAEASRPLRLTSILHFGIVAPMALVGVWVARRNWRRLWPLFAMIALYTVTLLIFYVFGRYRLPLVPFLLLLAAAGLAGLRRFWDESSSAATTGCVAALIVAAVFCNWPIADPRVMRAVTEFNASVALEEQGQIEEALAHLQNATRLDPRLASAHNNLGRLLVAKGQRDDAAAEFERALALDPRFVQAHRSYGQLLLAESQLDRAASHFEAAIEIDPDEARTYHNLGVTRARQQRIPEAIAAYERAVALDPAFAPSHNNFGVLLARSGRVEEAAARYEQALTVDPQYAEAHANLGIVLAMKGRLDEAAAHLERALALGPPTAQMHNNLGLVLLREGRVGAAAAQFEAALALEPAHAEARKNLARIRER